VRAGCAVAAPVAPPRPAPAVGAPAEAPAAAAPAPVIEAVLRPRGRWVRADWSELVGWQDDRLSAFWPALQASCTRPAPGWSELCARVLLAAPAGEAAQRAWLMQRLAPWRLEATDGNAEGLVTGYFEPLIDAARKPRGEFRVPLFAPPPDLAPARPWFTRQQLDTMPGATHPLRGREIAWLADPMDALLLQVQGSGRLRLVEADGRASIVRLAFAGHNEQPYRSVGRWLIERGEMTAESASWPAIKAWAKANPKRVQEMLWSNPRVVFFREEPLPDPAIGPRGAQGVPLVPQRSIAVDPASVPYGTPVWLDTTEPLSSTPLRRLVVAQDTGGAIVGAVRADYFWGWGAEAEAQAGRMKQPLRMWALWPRGARPEGEPVTARSAAPAAAAP
jgi:membrane-bound lytic murein transglycosylase A